MLLQIMNTNTNNKSKPRCSSRSDKNFHWYGNGWNWMCQNTPSIRTYIKKFMKLNLFFDKINLYIKEITKARFIICLKIVIYVTCWVCISFFDFKDICYLSTLYFVPDWKDICYLSSFYFSISFLIKKIFVICQVSILFLIEKIFVICQVSISFLIERDLGWQ